jgi:integrase
MNYLGTMKCFFTDVQEWEWTSRQFDPKRVFRVPKSILTLIGPSPRTIADDLWAKLLWAGLNLNAGDLAAFGRCVGKSSKTATRRVEPPSYYPLPMVQALAIVWLFGGLRSDEIVRLRVGCARIPPTLQPSNGERRCWTLDVPVSKTQTALTKPIDLAVGEAIAAWEAVRPNQPMSIDRKTGERVRMLFSIRARAAARQYLNNGLIPMLCRKAGIPPLDARGRISSHRARATIATQLFNARDPMSLHELQAWLGHRCASSTQHYVAFTPTRLAKAYSDADYFRRNIRMMDVLIDQQAVKQGAEGQPWRFYDLGHGLCSYEFFDQCPHRMACARCNFYIPKDSSQAQLLTSKAGMIHMLQEIPLTDEERAAVEGDKIAVEKLLTRLQGTPTPG